MDFQNRLASLLNRNAPPTAPDVPAPVKASGLVQRAADVMQSRPYQLHVKEMQALGQRPLTPEEFMAQEK